tara:strand:+ start:934 stop:1470 length:537 start_codon:yes stop_codon:yes gene_type:complete
MKKKIKILSVFILALFFTNTSVACDLFNIKPGSNISSLYNIIGDVDIDFEGYEEESVFSVVLDNDVYCKNSQLKYSTSHIFIYNELITGIEIQTSEISKRDPSVPDDPLYNFLNGNYVVIDQEVTAKNWTGVIQLPYGENFILYAKLRNGEYILESALITNEEYSEKTESEELIELYY